MDAGSGSAAITVILPGAADIGSPPVIATVTITPAIGLTKRAENKLPAHCPTQCAGGFTFQLSYRKLTP